MPKGYHLCSYGGQLLTLDTANELIFAYLRKGIPVNHIPVVTLVKRTCLLLHFARGR